MNRSVVALLVCVAILPVESPGWGLKGHMMAARVAARALPDDMPPFFRAAVEPLAYMCPEPDRWRGASQPLLTAATASDHGMRLERLAGLTLPATRYEYVALVMEKGLLSRDNPDFRNIGTSLYAIIEEAERLTTQFRLWREMQEAQSPDPAVARQLEANVLFSAGVLSHWITDNAQPLHTSVHTNGWAAGFPNPKGYEGKMIHSRFETTYVEIAIEERDIASRLAPPRDLGEWRAEAEAHLRRSHQFVDQVYAFDQRAAWGSGEESKEAHTFTAERLAYGASVLRDVWHAAWRRSGEQLVDAPVRYYGARGRSVLDLLRAAKRIETRDYDFGKMVTAIGTRRNGDSGRNWHYFVNGTLGSEAADRRITRPGDIIEWRFQR